MDGEDGFETTEGNDHRRSDDDAAELQACIAGSLATARAFKLPAFRDLAPATSAEDLVASFTLRRAVYAGNSYEDEFCVKSGPLEYDEFDGRSVTFVRRVGEGVVSSFRIAADGPCGLPSDKYCPQLGEARRRYGRIMEISRMVVAPSVRRIGWALADDLIACSLFCRMNKLSAAVYVAERHVYEMYDRLIAPQEVIVDHVAYGRLRGRFVLVVWDPHLAQDVFHSVAARRAGDLWTRQA